MRIDSGNSQAIGRGRRSCKSVGARRGDARHESTLVQVKRKRLSKPAMVVGRATAGTGTTVSAMPLDRSLAARACSNELLRWSYDSISVITAFSRASNGLGVHLPRPPVAGTLTREGVRYLMQNCVRYVFPGV
jgi:hypothetical protein